MSDSNPASEPVRICPNCGARQPKRSPTCWLCGHGFGEAVSGSSANAAPPMSFSLSSLLLVMTLACICLALLAVAPGLGIFAGMVLIPVFIRSARVMKVREARGIETSRAEKWSLVLGSFFVAVAMATIVSFTAFAAFCFTCLAGYSMSGRGDDSTPIIIAFIVGGAVTLFMVYLMARWARERYRRDIGD